MIVSDLGLWPGGNTFVEVLTRFCGNELVWLLFHKKIPLLKIIRVTLSFCPQNKPGLESTKEMYGGIFCALSLLYRPFAPE